MSAGHAGADSDTNPKTHTPVRSSSISFRLNGSAVRAEGWAIHTTLLDFVRSLGFTGAKEGCAEGECGACNVVCVRQGIDSPSQFQAVNSCLLLLPMADGQEIYTVEALAKNGSLTAAQQALAEGGGSQCGYCTPGFVMSLFAEYYRPGRQGACDPHSMGGNLCRCTGYRPIRDAALSLSVAFPDDVFSQRLRQPAPAVTSIDYSSGAATFLRPATLAECLREVQIPGSKVIAGATDLGVESNLRFRRWNRLISLEAAPELQEFSETASHVTIGAALPLTDLANRWKSAPAVFHEWLHLFASPTLRNRATLGGNLVTASPIGDSAPFLLAMNATLNIVAIKGERLVPLEAFFTGYRKTLLEPGELIHSIHIPKPFPRHLRFYKIAKRQMDDISTVAAAFALELDSRGRVNAARFAFGGVAAVPMRAVAAEEAIIGRVWNLDAVERAQAALQNSIQPMSDHRGSAEYRLEVSKSLLEKFWCETQEARQ